MKTFKQIDKLWDEYCKATEVDICEEVYISYNSCELEQHKVEIHVRGKEITMSVREAALISETLIKLTRYD